MPSVLNEAFQSPFHRSNPASQFYNLGSYTRSSSTNSLRNELYQSDFNNQYYLGTKTVGRNSDSSAQNSHISPQNSHISPQNSHISPQNSQAAHQNAYRLPNYNPSNRTNSANTSNHSIEYPRNNNSLRSTTNAPMENYSHSSSNKNISDPLDEKLSQTGSIQLNDDPEYENLINQVLSNQKYRKMLKKLLINDEDRFKSKKEKKQIVEGFSDNHQSSPNLSQETIKTILIYSLGGLLILCILDLFIRLGQILSRLRSI